MAIAPDAPISAESCAAIAAAFDLGEPVISTFVARGAMGAVHCLTTNANGEPRSWTVKRSYWNHFDDAAVAAEVAFASQCRAAGIPAPRSIPRVGGGFVFAIADPSGEQSQVRVLEWVGGQSATNDDPRVIPQIAAWMASIHHLAIDPADARPNPWFTRVDHDWDALLEGLSGSYPELAGILLNRLDELKILCGMVNEIPQTQDGLIICHTDIGADNIIWTTHGPVLIDWEDAGPLTPTQHLAPWVRSLGDRGPRAYRAYCEAGGRARITDPECLASSVAVHCNYLGSQIGLLLNPAHPEQHEFARSQVTNALVHLPTMATLHREVALLNT